MEPSVIALAVMVALSVGGLLYVFIYPYLSGEAKAEKRKEVVSASRKSQIAEARLKDMTTARRKSVADSLKELETQQIEKGKTTLQDRIIQAGLTMETQKFYIFSAVSGVLVAAMTFFLSSNMISVIMAAVIGAFGLPNWVLSYLKKRRIKLFIKEFPNAIDIIVRGIKSGLPLGDCIRIIASESQEPIKTEFKAIVDAQSLGLSIAEACARLVKRLPIQEANFFSIVIQIQQTSGGNLAETLANLSRVLRDRKRMKDKIGAMSMEAKTSGIIIAAMPIFVVGMLQISSPSFLLPLFNTQAGHIALLASAFWMGCGIVVMKSMINFDI
jgi:tight adherence protein B